MSPIYDAVLLREILSTWATTGLYARYGHPVYLVGSALETQNFYGLRDIDIVVVLPDDEFEKRFGKDWEYTQGGCSRAMSRWAREVGKLSAQAARTYPFNFDLKVQSESWMKARHADKPRLRIDRAEYPETADVEATQEPVREVPVDASGFDGDR